MKKLPPTLIADFYKNVLVKPNTGRLSSPRAASTKKPSVTVEKKVETRPAIRFLGENKQQVTIIVHTPDYPYLADNELELLTKMLVACSLHLDDIALVNEFNSDANWQHVQEELTPIIALFFGSQIWQQQLPFAIPYYQVQPHGSQLYLTAPALQSFTANTEAVKTEKQKLWTALQKLFKKK